MATDAPDALATTNARGKIGFLLVRVIVPLWILSGALFKLWERNPKLLPGPVRDVSLAVARWFGVPGDSFGAFLDHTLRFLIGTELLLVFLMVFVPKIARLVAAATLSLFVLVLVGVMRQGGDKCGCFGAGGPPPWAMLTIDSLLLLGVLTCKPAANLLSRHARTALLAGVGAVLAFAVAYGVPNPTITLPPGGASPQGPSGASGGSMAGATAAGGATAGAPSAPSAWPAPPAAKTTYLPEFAKWVGKPLREQDLAQQISRPLPDGVDHGAWFVVFYRGDCEHCHDLMERYMAGDRADRTLVVRVPDTDPSNDQPLPSQKFNRHTLPAGANYVFTTPVLLAVVDGVVAGLATDPDDEAAMKAALAAGAAPSGAAAAPPSAAAAATPPTAAAAPWPGAPSVQPTYAPDFETWKGRRLDGQNLALQILPAVVDLNRGRWHVLFYRADCDHCHDLMANYLVGEREPRVVAVRVPDTDPAQDLEMPLTNAVLRGLPLGVNYVFTTPVLLTVVDGVVVGLSTDPENDAEVRAALDAK